MAATILLDRDPVLLYVRRYSYTLSESFWDVTSLKWVSNDNMLPATVLSRDHFGGGYFSQFLVWWWVPTLTAIICTSALPSVPYAERVGTRKAMATLICKVL